MDVNLILKEFFIKNKSYLYVYLVFLLAFPISSVLLPLRLLVHAPNHKTGSDHRKHNHVAFPIFLRIFRIDIS